MSELYEINEEFRRQLLKMERTAASQMVREYGKAWRVIQQRVLRLCTEFYAMSEQGKNPPMVWLLEADRLQGLQAQVEAEYRRFAQYAGGSIENTQQAAVIAARKSSWEMMRSSIPPGVSVKFNQVPTKAFENLIGFLQDGSPLSSQLNQLPGEAAQQVANGLQNGLILGWNPTRTAGSIRKALAGNLARALRIARTETLRSFREANLQTFQANAHVLRGWRWASARNERTCAMCWAMDGTEHSFEEHMDEHICGRCSMVPITRSWKDLGFDIDEIEGLHPATGAEAFTALSNTEQLRILGPAKYAAWKEGKFTFPDLVGRRYDPQWGWTRYEKSLVEIVGKDEAKVYTRLALMGVAGNAGNYSAEDLIRIGQIGLRDLSVTEIGQIKRYLTELPFTSKNIEIPKSLRGVEFQGEVFGRWANSATFHWYKRTIQEKQWAQDIQFGTILSDLKKSALQEDSQLVYYLYRNQKMIGVLSKNRLPQDHLGELPGEFIYSIFSLSSKVIISGYQTNGLEYLFIPPGAKWLTK